MEVDLQRIRERFASLCRFCLSEHDCVPIFDDDSELNDLLSKTVDVLLTKVDESDGLPNNVCSECIRCIERFVDFEAVCAKSYELLEQARQDVDDSLYSVKCEEAPEDMASEHTSKEDKFAPESLESHEESDTVTEPVVEHLEEEHITIPDEQTVHLEEIVGDVQEDVEELDEPMESTSYNLSKEQQQMLDAAMDAEPCGFVERSSRKIPLIECMYCKNVYRGRNTLKKHLRIHLNIKDYRCEHCSRTFTDRSSLRIHESHHGKKSLQCPHCHKTYFSQNELRQHMTMQHLERKFSCDTCQRKFPSKTILNDHLRVHLPDRPFVCKYCGVGFKRNRNLLRHQTGCEVSRGIDCKVCSKSLKSPILLLAHLKKHHLDDLHLFRNDINSCQSCDAGAFKDFEKYLQHLQEHCNVECTYSCGECNKYFKTKSAVSRHTKFHNGDGNYACEIEDCRTYYSFGSHFEQHVSDIH